MTSNHSGTLNSAPSPRELAHSALTRVLAGEGIVLLKNEGLLPLHTNTPLALLGAGAVQTVKGGTGSGDVNNRGSISIRQGMEEAGVSLVSRAWLDDYTRRYAQARLDWKDQVLEAAKHYENPFGAYAEHPFALPDGAAVEASDLTGAKAAMYVVSRIAGEGKDRQLAPGDYYLSDRERADLQFLNGQGIPTVLLLNAGGPVELTDLLETCPMVRAVLFLSQLGQEHQRLVGFAKTGVVAPGGEETVTISIPQMMLASFSEELHGWVIQQGRYGLWVGDSCADARLSLMLEVAKTAVIESVQPICPLQTPFQRLSSGDGEAVLWQKMAIVNRVPVLTFQPRQEPKAQPKAVPAVDIPTQELVPLLFGNVTEGASTLGSAGKRVPGSAGETSERLEEKWDIPSMIMADGPAGLRLRQSYEVDPATDSVYGVGVLGSLENGFLEPEVHHEGAQTWYQFCTAFPVGTALAQSWNTELMTRFGQAIGREMREFGVHLWLAPGMNLHRNPLNGRNFEYYSEDPVLSGTLAAAVTRGVQSVPGCGVTIKHFACNHQEDNRMGVDVRIHERTLRELYLSGFEIAVKEGRPRAMMTSYNCINGVHAANSYDLCTVVALQEWGFEGIIMSDWNTTVPEDGSVSWKCAAAGNDIIMPGSPADEANIRKALADGLLAEADVRACAERVIALARTIQAEERQPMEAL